MGAIQIPLGNYHRSQSEKEGIIDLNQAIRDKGFYPTKECSPASVRSNKHLRKDRQADPGCWMG